MIKLPNPLLKLVDSFKELPGVGVKTAERLAYYIYENDSKDNTSKLLKKWSESKDNVKLISEKIERHLEMNTYCSVPHTYKIRSKTWGSSWENI